MDLWTSSFSAAKQLGLNEKELSAFRESGFFKPGIHWKSSSCGQIKPWNPDPVYNVRLCKEIIAKEPIVSSFDKFAA